MKKLLLLFVSSFIIQATAQSTLTAQQWQDDLKFLQETVHSDYPFLFKKTTAEEFDSAVAQLKKDIPKLEDHEIVVGFSKIIALFKYGHTDISFRHEPLAFRILPFNLYQFNDGIYIQGTHTNHKEALGAKVIAIEDMPIEKALETIYPVVNSENSQYFKAFGINYLKFPEVLHATRITSTLKETVSLTLEKNGKTFEHKFTALQKGERPAVSYSLIQTEGDWLDARDQSKTPHYLKHLDKHYYFEFLKDYKTVYVRQSSVFHDPTEDIPTFYNRVFDFIENNDVERLVIDVRLNGGGNNFNNKDVITGIIKTKKINQVGRFFVILGRRTFSACQNLVNEMDNYTNAIFVGEPTAENINFYGDNNQLALPNSGIPIFLSWAWWQDKPQWQDGPWLAPHIAIDMSFEDYRTNADPILKTALNFSSENFVLDPMKYMTDLYQKGESEKLMTEVQRMIADPIYRFFDFEAELNKTGYNILGRGNAGEAIAVFSFVTQLFPDSANAWDSLAEGYLKAGDKAKATEYYSKALEMDPEGPTGKNAKQQLELIESGEN
ncbi:tetratricopeptide repeat protein [Flavobacteriaceae bacterium MAR_2010_72]|nr:tetratricopeptide repeat protein [Flavobacteriaceae bacterium MAR_2010_72]